MQSTQPISLLSSSSFISSLSSLRFLRFLSTRSIARLLPGAFWLLHLWCGLQPISQKIPEKHTR